MPAERSTVYGQPSWRLATGTVEAFVTEQGGHLGPVTFRLGLVSSVGPNPISERGWPTHDVLDPGSPLDVRYVAAVAAVAEGFDHVAGITPDEEGVVLRSVSGRRVRVPLDLAFLSS